MNKYRFPFAAVERVRKLHRDEQRLRLADAYRAEGIVERQQQALFEEFVALNDQKRVASSKPQLDVNKLLAAQSYELVLLSQQRTLQQQSKMLVEEVERRRELAVESERSLVAMEKLDHRFRETHRSEEQLSDAKQLDEIAQQRFAVRRR